MAHRITYLATLKRFSVLLCAELTPCKIWFGFCDCCRLKDQHCIIVYSFKVISDRQRPTAIITLDTARAIYMNNIV